MVKTKNIGINGVEYVKSYSTRNVYIERDGEIYSEAIDPVGTNRTYTETDVKVEEITESEE